MNEPTKWEYDHLAVRVTSKDRVKDGPTGASARVIEEAEEKWLAALNERGAEGWELVGFRTENDSTAGGHSCQWDGILKRRV